MGDFKAYFAIEKQIKSLGVDIERSELISQFTDNRKSGLSEMSDFEYAEFLRWLNRIYVSKPRAYSAEACNNMRRKIIALFHKMGYKLDDGKIDMKRLNDWCVKYGHKHVELSHYDYNELTMLLTQAEKTYKSFISGI